MQSGERISFLLKLILPILALVSLNVYPVSYAVADGLRQSRVAAQENQPQEAAKALRQVIEREPWRIILWEKIGLAELAAARLPEALTALERAENQGQLSAEGRYHLADAYELAGNHHAAETTWQALLAQPAALPPDLERQAFEHLVRIQRQRGDYQAATETLRAWLQSEPDNPHASFLLGLHLAVVQPDQAIPFLVDASQRDSAYTPLMQKIRRGLNQAAEASSPGYDWVMIGRALGSAGQWDIAAEAFRRATVAAPQYAEAWAFLAEARYQIDGSGQEELERAAVLDPQSVVTRTLIALNFRRQGDPEQALVFLKEVASQEPEEPIWQVELANTEVQKGDLQAALAHFQKAVDLAPTNSSYWQHLARFSAEYNMNIEGIGLPAARQAVVLAPEDPAALDVIGWMMIKQSDFASAERFLLQAIEIDATYPEALLHLGQLYIQQQDMERAYPYLDRAFQYSNQDSVKMVARRLLRQYFGEDRQGD